LEEALDLSFDRLLMMTTPMKMKQTGCSETSAHKIQMPRNHPKETAQHLEHGESLRPRTLNLNYTHCNN